MSKIFTWIGAAAIGVGIAGYNSYTDSVDEKAVLTKYDFTEQELTGFRLCQKGLQAANISFDGTTGNQGCGCITRGISDNVDAQFRQAAHELDYIDSWYASVGYKPEYESEWQKRVQKVKSDHNMSTRQMDVTSAAVEKVINQCAN
ncbi:MAG: hypothetical protein QNJ29_08875 [Rhizobiaceae bacterium]|nr:hypothetical protein [Rhizobiaceae bacterium]